MVSPVSKHKRNKSFVQLNQRSKVEHQNWFTPSTYPPPTHPKLLGHFQMNKESEIQVVT